VGQLFRSENPAQAGRFLWKVALTDGAAAITEVQASLLRADPTSADPVGKPLTLTASQFTALPPSTTRLSSADSAAGFPATAPTPLTASRRLCLVGSDAKRPDAQVRIDPTVPSSVAVDASSTGGRLVIDQLHLPRAHGALVEAVSSATAPAGSGTISVVTDTGVRYPLADRTVTEALGYAGVTPLRVPAELVALLPDGPSLDPARARRSGPGTD
jgi:hypothetical protein